MGKKSRISMVQELDEAGQPVPPSALYGQVKSMYDGFFGKNKSNKEGDVNEAHSDAVNDEDVNTDVNKSTQDQADTINDVDGHEVEEGNGDDLNETIIDVPDDVDDDAYGGNLVNLNKENDNFVCVEGRNEIAAKSISGNGNKGAVRKQPMKNTVDEASLDVNLYRWEPQRNLPVVSVPAKSTVAFGLNDGDWFRDTENITVENRSELEAVEEELLLLRKRKELLELKKQLGQLEKEVNVPRTNEHRLNFNDIEHAILKFAGDDRTQDVNVFLEDFEQIMRNIKADGAFKLLSLRRSLIGAAQCLLRTPAAVSYDTLKCALLQEFGAAVTRQDVYRMLRERKWKKNSESMHFFVLSMQNIAARSDVTEMELIDFIIDAFKDAGLETTMFLGAPTLLQLKSLIIRYQTRYLNYSSNTTPAVGRTNVGVPMKNQSVVTPSDIRCFNCSGKGHYKSACPYDVRPDGSCFKCWRMGHNAKECPNQRKVLVMKTNTAQQGAVAQAAAVHSIDETVGASLEAINLVSVAFANILSLSTVFTDFYSLFDTGSPINFIKKSFVRCEVQPIGDVPRCSGIGGKQIKICGQINCYIRFKNQTEVQKLYVIPDESMFLPIILGRSFLNMFNIKLVKMSNKIHNTNKLMYTKEELLRIKFDIENKLNMTSFYCAQISDISNPVHRCNLSDCSHVDGKEYVSTIDQTPLLEHNLAKLHINSDLSMVERNKLEAIIRDKYVKPTDVQYESNEFEVNIHVTNETPFYSYARRLTYHERDELKKIIDELLKKNIIRHSNSPYASPIVLPKRKDGRYRLCINYKALNKVTTRNNFPLPLIEDCIDNLGSKKYFTLLDLKNGFHQVKMAESSIKYTAFITPDGHYEYKMMPFGLKNGPAEFQQFINGIFRNLIDERKISIYLDDIMIASADLDTHMEILAEVLQKLTSRGLELNLEKSKFCHTKVIYLGYEISKEGIKVNDDHLEAIKKFPMPKNVKELQSALGLFSYFRKFVKSFSTIASPLQKLMSKEAVFNMNQKCKDAFNKLKDCLMSAPILSIYDRSRITELHTDASALGFGAALMQKQDDGRFHPIFYFSKTTTPEESRQHSFILETAAIIYALRRFEIYLKGIPFKIITDCNSLAQTLDKKAVNPKIARWALELEDYDYTINHRAGTSMGHVDALSRCHQIAAVDTNDIDFQLQVAQSRDTNIIGLRSKLEKEEVNDFKLYDGLVYKRDAVGRFLFFVPEEMEDNVIRTIHEKIGHLGIDKCCEQLKMHYWFPRMRCKVENFIKNCVKCLFNAAPLRKNERNLYNIPKKPIPFDTIHIDHLGPLPALQSKKKHIFAIIDAFTKFVKLYPVNSTSTKEVINSLQSYFQSYSRPVRIVSDRGTCFTSHEFAEFLSKNNINHIKNATAAPRANGQIERVNRVLNSMLSKLSEPIQHADWAKKLPSIEFAINNSIHRSTGKTPSKLLFGVEQRGTIIDELTEYLEGRTGKQMEQDIEMLRTEAEDAILKSQKYNEEYFLRKNTPAKTFKLGDYVVIRNTDVTVGTNKKLIPKYRGPYVVSKVLGNDRYVVNDIENCQITQLPFNGVVDSNRIRRWLTNNKVVNGGNTYFNFRNNNEDEDAEYEPTNEDNDGEKFTDVQGEINQGIDDELDVNLDNLIFNDDVESLDWNENNTLNDINVENLEPGQTIRLEIEPLIEGD